jgi:hypothetical protein
VGTRQSTIRRVGVVVAALIGLLIIAPMALIAGGQPAGAPPSGSGIPPVYMGIYALGEQTYHVNRFLLAAIHFQETRGSVVRATSPRRRGHGG